MPMIAHPAFSSRNWKIFTRGENSFRRVFDRVAMSIICGMATAILVSGWSVVMTPLLADASSENGLIFYVEVDRLYLEAGKKTQFQRIENIDGKENKQEHEHQLLKDTSNEIRSGSDHE